MAEQHSESSEWRTTMERRIIHLDETFSKSISTLSQNQAATQSTLDIVVRTLDGISTRINQPNNTNWWGMISALVALILLMAGGVTMKVAPLEAALKSHSDEIAANTAVITERAFYMGKQESAHEHIRLTLAESKLENQRQWELITTLREEAAAALVARKDMSAYIRDVDQFGSRAWIDSENPKHD